MPEPEQTQLETEEAAAIETSPEENTEAVPIEAAEVSDASEEASIDTEEAVTEELSADNEEAVASDNVETEESEVSEEILEEPLITVEDVAPELDQPSDEGEDVLLIETPEIVDDVPQVVEEAVHAANPRDAPPAAQHEIDGEETQAAEDIEDSESEEE